jgi:hypothetical protein
LRRPRKLSILRPVPQPRRFVGRPAQEVIMTRALTVVAFLGPLALTLAGACDDPKLVANADGLSLAERIAKREAAEKKVAADLAKQERERLLTYDRGKLALHTQVFAFITKTRAAWDDLEKKSSGDAAKDKAAVEKLQGTQRASIVAMGKKMATIDPKGGNSNVTTDYDVMLNSLANQYPEALLASLDGAKQALGEEKAELDKRTKKITDWLAELKAK